MAIIIVLGMHRSGTSMLARALARMGADPGREVTTAPAPDNQNGYWENAGVVELQERLLEALDRAALSMAATQPLPAGWLEHPATRKAEGALQALLAAELAARPDPARPLLVKDPRTPPLLPMWQRVLARLGETPRYVLALRHPAAVGASLAARSGMAPLQAEALWLRHHADILAHAGDALAARVEYDRLLAAPAEGLAALAAALGLPPPPPELANDLTGLELRHHLPGTATRLPLTEALYQALAEGTAPPSLAGFEAALALLAATPGWLDHALSYRGRQRLAFASARLRNGNPWTAGAPDAILLHPNAPGEPPPILVWQVTVAADCQGWVSARVEVPAAARPMRLVARLRRNDEVLARTALPLQPGDQLPMRLDLGAVPPGPARLELSLALGAEAPDHAGCGVLLRDAVLEWR